MRPNLEKLDADSPALLLHDELAPVYTVSEARSSRRTATVRRWARPAWMLSLPSSRSHAGWA